MSGSLFARFRSASPDSARLFVKTQDGRTITYGELFALSARYANVLRD